ncbi:MAG: hypothetical protein IJX38_00205 [Clostridia bacterium]|nr:hypothetical protein [Clostridia bacterium]
MTKIKLSLFEGIFACTILPNIGLIFNTALLIISLAVKQEPVVYKAIIIAYICCIALLVISLLLCFAVVRKSKNELVSDGDSFTVSGVTYSIQNIASCEYYVCKWYAIPIAFIYKQQAAGLLSIKMQSGEKLNCKIMYRDFLKIKKVIKGIKER